MSETLTELDVVALLQDLPVDGLERGQTGTIVLIHDHGEAYEVEFIQRPRGSRKPAAATIRADDLLKLKGYNQVAETSTA